MHVELRNIEAIRPYEQNPRLNDQAVEAVAKSLREFGFRQPIVVDGDGVIIVGHTRWKAAQKLGLKQVPVHVATDLTPAQVKAYRLADNQTATLAEWNYELLPIELRDLQGLNFDLSLLGFSDTDLTEILAPPVNEGLTDPDAVPEPPDEAITQPGDLWILGNHRLLCGDAGEAADVDRLLEGAPIHLVNTDPPYNVKVEPRSNNAIAAGLSSFPASDAHQGLMHHQSFDVARQGAKHATTEKLRPKDRPLANDFVSDEAFEKMLRAWFGNIARVLIPGRCFYILGGYANCGNLPPHLPPPHAGRSWRPSGRPERHRATYHRPHGVRHWLAFYDVHGDELWGYVRKRKRRQEVLDVLKRMRRRYPLHLRIHLILDNFSPHGTPEVRTWCAENNVHLVWTPTNASWLNPIECHFMPVKEFVISNSDPDSHAAVAIRLRRYAAYRNRHARQKKR